MVVAITVPVGSCNSIVTPGIGWSGTSSLSISSPTLPDIEPKGTIPALTCSSSSSSVGSSSSGLRQLSAIPVAGSTSSASSGAQVPSASFVLKVEPANGELAGISN